MRSVVIVPTYQEAGNIEPFLRAVRAAAPNISILVCDDNSPDGTGEIAEKVLFELGQGEVLHRPQKEGLGAAYRHGFTHAVDAGFEIIIHMDVDFSHDPALLPQMEAVILDGHDVAVGSRYVPGGSTPDWPVRRRLLSRYGNEYARAALSLKMHDATAGFRAYSVGILRATRFETTRSNGYGFMIEMSYRLTAAGADIRELPIVFHDRVAGESKMSVRIMAETMLFVTWWGLCMRAPVLTGRFRSTTAGRGLASRTRPPVSAAPGERSKE